MQVGSLSTKLPWEQAQTKWAAAINPVLANPLISGNLISNIKVKSGLNVINHGLGVNLQGYLVVMNSAPVTFYDNQSLNQMPDKTLYLVASGPSTITVYCF